MLSSFAANRRLLRPRKERKGRRFKADRAFLSFKKRVAPLKEAKTAEF